MAKEEFGRSAAFVDLEYCKKTGQELAGKGRHFAILEGTDYLPHGKYTIVVDRSMEDSSQYIPEREVLEQIQKISRQEKPYYPPYLYISGQGHYSHALRHTPGRIIYDSGKQR